MPSRRTGTRLSAIFWRKLFTSIRVRLSSSPFIPRDSEEPCSFTTFEKASLSDSGIVVCSILKSMRISRLRTGEYPFLSSSDSLLYSSREIFRSLSDLLWYSFQLYQMKGTPFSPVWTASLRFFAPEKVVYRSVLYPFLSLWSARISALKAEIVVSPGYSLGADFPVILRRRPPSVRALSSASASSSFWRCSAFCSDWLFSVIIHSFYGYLCDSVRPSVRDSSSNRSRASESCCISSHRCRTAFANVPKGRAPFE